ncbi:MAG TPA: hypothetical protein VG815_00360 [Chloroflexota bacterium]|nr:hypothetical protein [Chloroflexota bacterium]
MVYSALYGDGVKIMDPANPSDTLSPTGVNAAGAVSALETAQGPNGVTVTPVVWSYSGSSVVPIIRVVPLQAPPGTGYTSGMTVAGMSDDGWLYGTGGLCSKSGPRPFTCWFHAIRWAGNGAGTDLGFGFANAVSPGDTIGGVAAEDTGKPNGSGGEIYNCGVYTLRGASATGQVKPNLATASRCDGVAGLGPYLAGSIIPIRSWPCRMPGGASE